MPKRFLILFFLFMTIISCGAEAAINDKILSKISFYKADLVAVLQQLAAECNYNVIVTPEVKGTVTIELTDSTFEEVLQYIVKSQNLVYQKEGRNFFVAKPGQLKSDLKKTAYFQVYYADPSKIVDILKKACASEEIYFDERTRTIVANGDQALLDQAGQLIQLLDKKMPQVTLEVKVVEVSLSALRRLGAQLQVNDSKLDWDATTSGAELIIKMISSGHSWSSIFKSLNQDGKARLVTSPSIATMNGQEASILIGDKIPIVTTTTDSNGDKTTNVSYLDVGVKLNFKPLVQQGDEIAIDIKSQVNSLGEKSGDYYIIGTREVNSHTQAKIGETIFLGGLINQEERESLMRIPLLSKIFLLGKLFQYSEKTKEETELIITITPRWNSSFNLTKTTGEK